MNLLYFVSFPSVQPPCSVLYLCPELFIYLLQLLFLWRGNRGLSSRAVTLNSLSETGSAEPPYGQAMDNDTGLGEEGLHMRSLDSYCLD